MITGFIISIKFGLQPCRVMCKDMCEIYDFSEKQKLIKSRRKLVRQNYSDLISNQNKTPTAAFIESYKYYNLLFPEISKSDITRRLSNLLNPT